MAKDEPKRRSIIGTLVDNKLTEREDDSTINITYVGRRSIDGLCSLAAKAGSKFSASELLTAYKDIEKQAKEEVYSGATVEFGFANNSLGVEGAVIGPGAGFDPAVNRVVMRCIPLIGLRPELDMIDVIINGTNEGMPTVTTLYDVFTKTTNAKLTPGNTLNGKGNRVKIAGSEGKEVGFFFIDATDETKVVAVPETAISRNEPSNFAFIAHAAPTGEGWNGKIADKIENAAGNSGDTADKPIFIKKAAELAYLAQQVNTGGYVLEVKNGNKIDNEADSNKQGFSGYYFALSDDIKLDGGLWTPIGHMHIFCGHFDGKGHTVDGLRIDQIDGYIGLFGCVNDGTICNLGVRLHEDGIKVASSYPKDNIFAGGIVGYLLGLNIGASLRNCFVVGDGKVEITAGYQGTVGAIAGSIKSSDSHSALLTHCYSTVDVEATTENQCYAGGIVGRSNSILSYTYATGSVKTNNATEQSAGGICGRREGGELTHNLALNSEVTVSGGSDSHRITGSNLNDETSPGSSFNYACPSMSLKNQPFTDDPSSLDGANTWADQFRNDLQNIPASPSDVNEWTTAWIWPDTPSGQPALLPQLKRLNPDGTYPEGSSTDNLLAGQPSLATVDFLSVQPDPASSIENLGGGDGSTAATPIRIRNAVELAYLARQVNNGGQTLQLLYGKSIDNTADDNLKGFAGYHFALSDDIDLKRQNWTPIGDDNSFRGHFDGKGHTVDELRVDVVKENSSDNTTAYAGLFGYVEDGTLCNLGVRLHEDGIKAVSNNNDAFAGGIVGLQIGFEDNTLLRNCFVVGNGKVEATAEFSGLAGGIAGLISFSVPNSATLTHCYATVDVEATANITCCAGGIAGSSYGRLSYTYATGSVKTNKTNQYAGGICGDIVSGELTHSLALNSEVTANGANAHRIASNSFPPDPPSDLLPVLDANYARPAMLLNNGSDSGSTTVTSPDGTSLDGADTWLDTFADNLASDDATNEGWKSGAWTWPTAPSTLLPKLALVTFDDSGTPNGFTPWPAPATTVTSGTLGSPVISVAQPDLDAADYLVNRPLLHVTQPAEGGTLAVYLADPANPTAPAPGTPTDGCCTTSALSPA